VTTRSGRVRYIPEIPTTSRSRARSTLEADATNAPVRQRRADLLKLAMIALETV